MRLKIRFPLRHPLYPDWVVTPVRAARGRSAALSGTYWELVRAAALGAAAERAVFVILYPDTPFLSDADRDVLWEAFQVPVYACLLDSDGRLVGYECEAQDGLHIGTIGSHDSHKLVVFSQDSILGYRIPLDQTVLEKSPCECGRPGQRLRFTGPRPAARRFELVTSPRKETPCNTSLDTASA